jgi:hypothetical protein
MVVVHGLRHLPRRLIEQIPDLDGFMPNPAAESR